MSEKISALIDQEIGRDAHSEVVEELCRDPDMQQRWERYHLIRSAIRGECAKSYLDAVYRREETRTEHAENLSSIPKRDRIKQGTSAGGFRTLWLNWAGGLGLAAGLSAAAVLGFVTSSLVDFQFTSEDTSYVEVLVNDANAMQWVSHSEHEVAKSESAPYLNQMLLAHSESTAYPLMNGLSNYARLVSYNR